MIFKVVAVMDGVEVVYAFPDEDKMNNYLQEAGKIASEKKIAFSHSVTKSFEEYDLLR